MAIPVRFAPQIRGETLRWLSLASLLIAIAQVPIDAHAQAARAGSVNPQAPAALLPDKPPADPPLPDARSGPDDPRRAAAAAARANRLMRQGQGDEALALLESALKDAPNDVQLQFLYGVLLSDRKRVDEALALFEKMTREFPELAEPHNNLATLYAARGELDKARVALERAVHALPDYAIAHENLGDVYAMMALRAYEKAASLDPRNDEYRRRLQLARDFIKPAAPATGKKP